MRHKNETALTSQPLPKHINYTAQELQKILHLSGFLMSACTVRFIYYCRQSYQTKREMSKTLEVVVEEEDARCMWLVTEFFVN